MGPSPIVPSLMVGVLGLVLFGPMIMSLADYILPLFQAGDEDVAFNFWTVLPLLLLLLIHTISSCFPSRGSRYFGTKQGSSSSSYDDGYGLGSLLLLVLFFVLYNVW
ncbi:hypothetical protein NC651_030253 [Populus alba x Populus x berolinensis]|nr:hypothetical protein NC651_030253 [Populus alba x Populus x berolinensis]